MQLKNLNLLDYIANLKDARFYEAKPLSDFSFFYQVFI